MNADQPVLIGLFGLTVILEEAAKGVRPEPTSHFKLGDGKPFSFSVFRGHFGTVSRASAIGPSGPL